MSEQVNYSRKSFTLIELLVVIAIIAMLASLMMPALRQARESARRATCSSNLRQQYLALQMYVSDFNNYPLHSYERAYPWASSAFRYIYMYDVNKLSSFSLLDGLGYLGSPGIMYCPSSGGIGSPEHSWPNDETVYPDRDPARTLSGGTYWGNYIALFVNNEDDWNLRGDNVLGSRQVAARGNNEAVFSADVNRGGSNIYGNTYHGNHIYEGAIRGANLGITDGSVRWYQMETLVNHSNSIRYRPGGVTMQWYWF